jgi:hypothetical protein
MPFFAVMSFLKVTPHIEASQRVLFLSCPVYLRTTYNLQP